jgi:hypothetical protein
VKKIASHIISLLLALQCFSQTTQWQWASASSGNGEQEGYDVTTDNSGNVYFTGSYYGTFMTFDTFALLNRGTANGFIAKFHLRVTLFGLLIPPQLPVATPLFGLTILLLMGRPIFTLQAITKTTLASATR